MNEIILNKDCQTITNVVNGAQTIILVEKFPRDYTGWVYLYCDKKGTLWLRRDIDKEAELYGIDMTKKCYIASCDPNRHSTFKYNRYDLSGHIVVRVWCEKVEQVYGYYPDVEGENYTIETETLKEDELLKRSYWTNEDIDENNLLAIHISKVEVFDQPKILRDFKRPMECWYDDHNMCKQDKCPYFWAENYGECHETGCQKYDGLVEVRKAPQTYCWVEGEE